MELAARLFSHVCGQVNLCEIRGISLPLCYRCTGLYLGAALAILLTPIRPRPAAAVLWVHGIFMLVMLPFGYHLIEHGPLLRLITGQLFGYGLIYYLLLIPLGESSISSARGAIVAYFTAACVGIAILPIAVFYGSQGVAQTLTTSCLLGLAVVAILAVTNIALIGRAAIRTILELKKLHS